MIGAIGAGVQLALGKSRYHLSPTVASARSADEKHYHVRQLVGGQTHTMATSRWEPAAEQGPGKHRQPMGLFTCCLQPLVRPV